MIAARKSHVVWTVVVQNSVAGCGRVHGAVTIRIENRIAHGYKALEGGGHVGWQSSERFLGCQNFCVSCRCSPTKCILERWSCTAPNTRAERQGPMLPQSSVSAY